MSTQSVAQATETPSPLIAPTTPSRHRIEATLRISTGDEHGATLLIAGREFRVTPEEWGYRHALTESEEQSIGGFATGALVSAAIDILKLLEAKAKVAPKAMPWDVLSDVQMRKLGSPVSQDDDEMEDDE